MPASDLEKLQVWLSSYPGWERFPGNVCVLPKEKKEVFRREDVMGNGVMGCRYYVNLIWETVGQTEDAKSTLRLLDFQSWVQEQSALGLAPHFGDVPAQERMRTEKGGLTAGTQIVTYTVTLVADFTKVYEVKN